ncbi:hypothetical protein K474DRAFT_337194 [Panus rudis PR-1116 ss-1]|nr:hypothetical protein K474DRAFT_337194 [Panus rudis PR-1116 ss-1]
MAGVPPTIPPTATQSGLETPSHEWASKTTSMLQPNSDTTNTGSSMNPTTRDLLTNAHSTAPSMEPTASASSAVSTPGIPGAYKPDAEERAGIAPNVDLRETASKVTQSVTEAAHSMGQTAASYLPTAAQYLPKGVVDTVAGYLPTQGPAGVTQASTHDTPHEVSLPSTELAGSAPGEHVSGVGALPGTIAEDAIAKAPDERNLEQQQSSGAGNTSGLTNIIGGTAVGGILGSAAEKAKETTEKAKQTGMSHYAFNRTYH